MDEIVINIYLAWNLTCILKTQIKHNPTVKILKYVAMLIFIVRMPNFILSLKWIHTF